MNYSKNNQTQNSESFSDKIINFFKSIFQDRKKTIIFISIIILLIILIIVIAVVASKKKDKNKNKCDVSESLYDIAIKELEKHNSYRKKHKVDNLEINCDLMEIAQKYSEKLQDIGSLIHSGDDFNGDYMGENLFWISTKEYSPPLATVSWYEEIEDYDFNTGQSKNGKAVGHFTQVVWKGSKEIGIGVSCGNKGCFVVANYYPAGNYIGQYTNNVLEESR